MCARFARSYNLFPPSIVSTKILTCDPRGCHLNPTPATYWGWLHIHNLSPSLIKNKYIAYYWIIEYSYRISNIRIFKIEYSNIRYSTQSNIRYSIIDIQYSIFDQIEYSNIWYSILIIEYSIWIFEYLILCIRIEHLVHQRQKRLVQ